jgi:hypothetical protein
MVWQLNTSAPDYPEKNSDDGDHKQCVNDASCSVTDKPDSPKNDQYHGDYIK